jgi:hypothetical protein
LFLIANYYFTAPAANEQRMLHKCNTSPVPVSVVFDRPAISSAAQAPEKCRATGSTGPGIAGPGTIKDKSQASCRRHKQAKTSDHRHKQAQTSLIKFY